VICGDHLHAVFTQTGFTSSMACRKKRWAEI